MPFFWSKTAEHSAWVGRNAGKSAIVKWANTLSLQKISLRLNAASHSNVRWYRDTDGFLEHSPSGASLYYKGLTLQKIICFGGSHNILEYEDKFKALQSFSGLYPY